MDDFVGKEFLQNCGDTLIILEKTSQKGKDGSFLFRCCFKRYPYELLISDKNRIKKGRVLNPRIEEEEFVNSIIPQHCGDSLKIVKKTENKDNSGHWIFEGEFQKYPCKVYSSKGNILKGTIINPQIEKIEFIDKEWPQNCGDTLINFKKSGIKRGTEYLWECEFKKYPCKIINEKKNIIRGQVENPKLPWKSKELLENFLKEYKEKPTLYELTQDLNLSSFRLSFLINEYNLRNYLSYYPTVSSKEKIVQKFLDELNIKYEEGSWILKEREIDIYFPELRFGIEFNGNYWHSNKLKPNNYHQEKSLLAQENGIQIFHIFEYEWNEKQEIIKSLIKSKLGIFDKKIGARNCVIKEISSKAYQDFCNKNHIQGSAGAKIALGLFYREELIQIMSFGVPRFSEKFEYEIIRECSKLGYFIIGGKNKLWSHFVKHYNPKSVISYCDFSKFTGNSYLKLGFEKERLNKPGFVWWDRESNQVFWRNPFKHKEMQEKYKFRIYDCGQLVFVWNK